MKFLFLASILLAGCLLADVIVAEEEEDADDTNTPAPDDEAADGEVTDAPDAEPSEEEEGTPFVVVEDPIEAYTAILLEFDSKPAEAYSEAGEVLVNPDSYTKSEDEPATDTSSNLIRSFMSFLIPILLASAIL